MSQARDCRLCEVAPRTFIYEWCDALPASTCEEIIRRFEASPQEQYRGVMGHALGEDQAVKRSTDLVLSGKPTWRALDRALFRSIAEAMRELCSRHPFFRGAFKDMGYAVQRTLPGEYYHWHIDGGSHSFSHRQLVAIWYLNDVPGPGGETEFRPQRVRISPRRGKLVLFPPFWTHEHRGVTLGAGRKYIATTWVVFA